LSFSYENKTVTAGQKLEFQVKAEDPNGDPITYGTEGALPSGAAFDPASGTFTWTPDGTQAGTYTVTFTATDTPAYGVAKTTKTSVKITVSAS
jgi:hypothetical protein